MKQKIETKVAEDWKIGDKINNIYEIFDIRKGGQGIVFITYNHEENYPVALKTYPVSSYASNKEFKDLLFQECSSWVRLGVHANIVQLLSFIYLDGSRPYMFLEYINGGSLNDLIYKSTVIGRKDMLTKFGLDFCNGMRFSLQKGLAFHGDVKPSNLLISKEYNLKITDFGLSKIHAHLGKEKHAGGTAPYMAPELFSLKKQQDIRSDIYSFGITLYEMFVGHLPYLAETLDQYRHFHENVLLPSVGDVEIDRIISRCTKKDSDKRYQDFDELSFDLTRICSPTPLNTAIPVSAEYANSVKISQAGTLIELEKAQEALTICNEVILNSSDPEILSMAWNHLGWAKDTISDSDTTVFECYHKAIKYNDKNQVAWVNYGYWHSRKGKLNEAIFCYKKAISISPNYLTPYTNCGAVLQKLNGNDEAEKYYLKSLEINPRYYRGHLLLFRLYRDTKIDHDRATIHAKQVLEIEPWDYETMIFLYSYYITNDIEHDYCIKIHHKLKSLHENTLAKEAIYWAMEARLFNKTGNHNKAAEAASKALMIDGQSYLALMEFAYSLRYSSNKSNNNAYTPLLVCKKLVEIYNRVIDINPKYPDAYRLKAISLTNLGEYKAAKECIEHGLLLNPMDSEMHNDLGNLYAKMENYEEALTLYEKAIKLSPTNEMYYYNLADCHIDMSNYEAAIVNFQKALDIRENYPEAWHSMGLCYQSIANFDRAFYCYTMTHFYNEKHQHVRYSLAKLHLSMGDIVEAKKLLHEAIDIYKLHNNNQGVANCFFMLEAIEDKIGNI